MTKPITRRLLEVRIPKKNIRCKTCGQVIWKGHPSTYCRIIGYWGSHHPTCFDKLSINLETEVTGELKPSSSGRAFMRGTQQRISILKSTNEG